jgi:hypothetical protein
LETLLREVMKDKVSRHKNLCSEIEAALKTERPCCYRSAQRINAEDVRALEKRVKSLEVLIFSLSFSRRHERISNVITYPTVGNKRVYRQVV